MADAERLVVSTARSKVYRYHAALVLRRRVRC